MGLRHYATFAFIGLASVVGAVACGPSASGLCEEICDCTGCSDDAFEDCVDDIEDLEKVAEEEGCEEEFDEALSCADDELRCSGSRVDVDGCDAELGRLSNCTGGPIIVGGGSVSPPPTQDNPTPAPSNDPSPADPG